LGKIPEIAAYRAQPAPKSTGRELFDAKTLEAALDQAKSLGLSREDILSTLLDFSIELAVEAYHRFVIKPGKPLKRILFTGGGAENPIFLARFQAALPRVEVASVASLSRNAATLEAEAFALFAVQALVGYPQNLPKATGASRAVICGEIAPGDNWRSLYRKVHSASRQNVSYLR
jgi:anhydro-N-acetylmuramic acid kinase